MNILFLGAPGCGKGTQSKIIIKKFGIPQISTGDLLREEIKSGSSLGEELQQIMSSGKFVSDELVLSLVSKKIEQDECKKGFILDGYPRNLTQAKNLDSLFKNKNIRLEYVFLIDVSFDVLIERCTGRYYALRVIILVIWTKVIELEINAKMVFYIKEKMTKLKLLKIG